MTTSADNPAPSRREREQARHRRDILGAAVALFAEFGYHQTTMQMIAERAEFSVGYLYKHFAGKEEMFAELVLFHTERMEELLDEVRDDALPPLDQIRRNIEVVSRHFNHHRDFMRIFHQGVGGDVPALLAAKERHQQEMETLLARAQADGVLGGGDPALLAAAIQGATKELMGHLAERAVPHPFDELAALVFALLIDNIRK